MVNKIFYCCCPSQESRSIPLEEVALTDSPNEKKAANGILWSGTEFDIAYK